MTKVVLSEQHMTAGQQAYIYKGGRRPAWLNKELLAEISWKRKVHGMWK